MMHKDVKEFINFIQSKDGIGNKPSLIAKVQNKFKLTKDRSIYYSKHFAVRFSYSSFNGFSNTVISLSNLQKYDDQPFFVCVITPTKNIIYLANTTFLKKISHSSQQLRVGNIRGSINGSDISKKFDELENSPKNFEKLFSIHAELGFEGNLERLVEATTNISPSGKKFTVSTSAKKIIEDAPSRAFNFSQSEEYNQLKAELDAKVEKYKKEILIAGSIKNINIRGRIIEYLIAGKNEKSRESLVKALHDGNNITRFRTKNSLDDYIPTFDKYDTAVDVKTKMMGLSSNPKGYNIDKLLEFLATNKSVFMFYFIGIESNKIVNKVLVSMFQTNLLKSTILLKHWSGRNSRGVTQFEGEKIRRLILSPNNDIDKVASNKFLKILIDL